MNTADDQLDELTSADDVAESPSGGNRRSPGSMLMAQRETLELSVQQVADQLNLTMHFVRAIESDSYDKLPGDVFVRGYIRAYARLLKLNAEQVLMIYEEFNSNKIARKEEAIKRRDRRRKDRNRPWIIISGFAFVAVAVALWYLNPSDSSDSTGSDNTNETAGRSATAVQTSGSVLSATPLASPLAQQSAARPEATAAPAIPTNDTAETVSPETESLPASESMPDESSQPAATASVTEPSQSAGVVQSDQVLQQNAASAATGTESVAGGIAPPAERVVEQMGTGRTISRNWAGTDELRLHFTNESWVEIEHRGGDERHRESSAASDTLVVRGTAPFSVLLGNARDVVLSFNGRQIDISSNIRADNTVRLSIGM